VFGLRKKAAPKRLPSNPGWGFEGKVAFHNAENNWVERFNLVNLLASVLRQKDHILKSEESWLVHKESGFILLPQIASFRPLDRGGVSTTTTIQVSHPTLVPDGIFEYQHSTGDNLDDSFLKGFHDWAETDLTALLEALTPMPETCTTLKMEFPEKDGKPAYSRRAVLGPPTHTYFVRDPRTIPERKKSGDSETQGEYCEGHDFCPCCLLTHSFEAFRELIEGNGSYALRLFAMRDVNGNNLADCRVNGTDWDAGADALRRYVATWPEAGIELRKQYVVLQTTA